ncbi:unnamed protein product, partial [Discosporangium mesarthrocarpum]
FLSDVRLTFDNAKTFNPEVDSIHHLAVNLSGKFES